MADPKTYNFHQEPAAKVDNPTSRTKLTGRFDHVRFDDDGFLVVKGPDGIEQKILAESYKGEPTPTE